MREKNIYIFGCGSISYGHAPDHHRGSCGCMRSVCIEPGDDYYYAIKNHLLKSLEAGLASIGVYSDD